MRSDALLSQLTDEQQADLYNSLLDETYAEVRKRLAKPPPDGLGLKVHTNTLFRFFCAFKEKLRSAVAPPDSAALLALSKSEFVHATSLIAQGPATPANYSLLGRALHRLESGHVKHEYLQVAREHAAIARERVQIERQRLDLQQREFEFNAARQALRHWLQLQQIHNTPGPDDEDKVWQARNLLFGPPTQPNPMGQTP